MTRYCLQCDDGTQLVHGRRDLVANVRGHQRTVERIAGWHCPVCGDVEFDAGEGQRYSATIDELTAEVAAEEAAMLKAARKRLRLTQKQAAALTGGGHNAFSRYEKGEARPLLAVVNLFRLLDRHPELLDELQRDAGNRQLAV